MYGKGLLKGLGVTGRVIFRKRVTEKYPEERPDIPSRWRGLFQLDTSKCTGCGICSRSCPNDAIKITTRQDENKRRKLAGYELNLSYCLLCGLCVEDCPRKSLKFTKDFETATYFKEDVVLDLFNNSNLSAPSSTFGQPDIVEKAGEESENK